MASVILTDQRKSNIKRAVEYLYNDQESAITDRVRNNPTLAFTLYEELTTEAERALVAQLQQMRTWFAKVPITMRADEQTYFYIDIPAFCAGSHSRTTNSDTCPRTAELLAPYAVELQRLQVDEKLVRGYVEQILDQCKRNLAAAYVQWPGILRFVDKDLVKRFWHRRRPLQPEPNPHINPDLAAALMRLRLYQDSKS